MPSGRSIQLSASSGVILPSMLILVRPSSTLSGRPRRSPPPAPSSGRARARLEHHAEHDAVLLRLRRRLLRQGDGERGREQRRGARPAGEDRTVRGHGAAPVQGGAANFTGWRTVKRRDVCVQAIRRPLDSRDSTTVPLHRLRRRIRRRLRRGFGAAAVDWRLARAGCGDSAASQRPYAADERARCSIACTEGRTRSPKIASARTALLHWCCRSFASAIEANQALRASASRPVSALATAKAVQSSIRPLGKRGSFSASECRASWRAASALRRLLLQLQEGQVADDLGVERVGARTPCAAAAPRRRRRRARQ